MKTEHKLAEALKEMMSITPLDDISVSALSDKCGVSRKTFYYHFHDIYDLLTLVFLNEKIDKIALVEDYTAMLTTIYKYYERHKGFIDASLNSAGKDLFFEFIYNNCYSCTMRFIINKDIHKKLSLPDRKNLSRFFASAYANSIVYYLLNYKHKTLDGLLNCFAFQSKEDLSKAINNLIKVREIKK